jgi:hypothetical protein
MIGIRIVRAVLFASLTEDPLWVLPSRYACWVILLVLCARIPEVHAQGVVSGIVTDSINGRFLANALVQFQGARDSALSRRYSVQSDSTGHFSILGVTPGSYFVGFYHGVLDSLGIEVSPRLVEIGPGDQRVDVATPSARTMINTMCKPNQGQTELSPLVIGHLREAGDLGSIAGAKMHFEWSEPETDSHGELSIQGRSANAETNAEGWFAICGLPPNTQLIVRGKRAMDSTGNIAITLAPGEVRQLTLHIGVTTTAEQRQSADAQSATLWRRGHASVKGHVSDGRGLPVENARATIWDTGVDAVTNSAGNFVLDSLPPGTHTLEVKKLGLSPIQRIVDLVDRSTTIADLAFEDTPVVLPTVLTRAEIADARNLAEFERHRTRGTTGGHFVTLKEIEALGGLAQMGRLVEGYPGVTVYRKGGRSSVSMVRPGTGLGTKTSCSPDIYLNGVRQFDDFGDIESQLQPDEIVGIEVYARATQRPAEFSYLPTKPCGAILIWTRTPKKKPGR